MKYQLAEQREFATTGVAIIVDNIDGSRRRGFVTKDTRLTRMVHVLVHMAGQDGMVSSGVVARMLGTNPVVVRRTMGLLRNAGLVRSEIGPGGGWCLTRSLDEITLLAVHGALQPTSIFTIDAGPSESKCKVEHAAEMAIGASLAAATDTFEAALANTTLADIRATAGF